MKHICILYSGGLDSAIMARFAEINYPDAKVTKVFFDIGQPYANKERKALPPDVEIRNVDWLQGGAGKSKDNSSSGDIYIPGRNLTLASLAASIYTPDEIWLGALLGETHATATDKNTPFRKLASSLFQYVFGDFAPEVRIAFPLAEAGFDKLGAVEWALAHGFTAEELMATSSCLSGEEGKCGTCVVCFRRWGIFHQLGIKEEYNVDPLSSMANLKIVREMIYGTYYDEHRTREVLPAFENVALNAGLQRTVLLTMLEQRVIQAG